MVNVLIVLLNLLFLALIVFLLVLIGFAVCVIWQSHALLIDNWLERKKAAHELKMAKIE